MNELIVANVKKYANMLAEKKYLQSGYIAVREEDGIVITNPRIDYTDVKEENLTFVNDKNIETLEGNFRAAAVILFCAIRQDKNANAAAIVDSDSTVEFSKKRRTLMPILDDLAQVCGVSIKCAQKNVASDVVAALSGQRNCCLLPEAARRTWIIILSPSAYVLWQDVTGSRLSSGIQRAHYSATSLSRSRRFGAALLYRRYAPTIQQHFSAKNATVWVRTRSLRLTASAALP